MILYAIVHAASWHLNEYLIFNNLITRVVEELLRPECNCQQSAHLFGFDPKMLSKWSKPS
jgi:hypothetical protein